MPGQAPGAPVYMVAWCHGAAGIAGGRLYAETRGYDFSVDIEAGLGTTARWAEQWYRLPGADFTACHGVFGLLDVLLDGVRTGRAAHATTIATIANYATEQFHRGERAWPSGLISHEEICGLMLGNAGIAMSICAFPIRHWARCSRRDCGKSESATAA